MRIAGVGGGGGVGVLGGGVGGELGGGACELLHEVHEVRAGGLKYRGGHLLGRPLALLLLGGFRLWAQISSGLGVAARRFAAACHCEKNRQNPVTSSVRLRILENRANSNGFLPQSSDDVVLNW